MVSILFIDDDPQAHKTLEHVLPDPYTLLSAYTGRQGIAAASREAPDLVLLDINLPDMDGISALRRIVALARRPARRDAHRDARAPLVKEAILAGACDYIVKPYELKELLGTLRIAVAGADARAAAASAAGQDVPGGLIGESAGHAGGEAAHPPLCSLGFPGSHPRGKRHRQGAGRAIHPRGITAAGARPASRSTAAPCRKRSWRRSFSGPRKAPLPTRWRGREASSRPTAARSSSTRSERWLRRRRPGSCASSSRRS